MQHLHLSAIFSAVFLAELGDKTQLATLLFAANTPHHPVSIFMAAAAALILSTALAVALGTTGDKYLSAIPLNLIAGCGFIAIGLWTVWGHFQG
jgi:putative Ca2+/H+ antiporter (TMEM165/GDT1 family)